ncbi:MAG TPA: ATP synthase subunit I [Casimicrobiaceae bacterium]|nr:ATP synthase subunit I [Casimicrobiaceae bacterium]
MRYPAGRVAIWQAVASLLIAAPSGWLAGWHGLVSALLGGLVNVFAGSVFGMLAGLGRPTTAGGTLHTMIRAEAAKITVIVLQLWAVLGGYRDVVLGAFFAAFVVTLLVSQAAILIRD